MGRFYFERGVEEKLGERLGEWQFRRQFETFVWIEKTKILLPGMERNTGDFVAAPLCRVVTRLVHIATPDGRGKSDSYIHRSYINKNMVS